MVIEREELEVIAALSASEPLGWMSLLYCSLAFHNTQEDRPPTASEEIWSNTILRLAKELL